MIVRKITNGPFQQNCYLIGDTETKTGMIIDPGSEPEKISSEIFHLGLSVRDVFNTHGHIDHIGAVESLRRSLGILFHLHPNDEPLVQKADQYAAMFSLPFDAIPAIDRYLQDQDVFMIGNLKMKVIHIPGHTPGCCGFYFSGGNAVFSGDTLFRESIGRTDLPGGNHEMILKSIREKLFALPGETVVYPGHGPETTIGHEKNNNPFMK